MFCVVMVRDVQPEIRPEVTRKLRKSFEHPRITRMSRIGSGRRGLGDMRNWDEIEVSRERKFVSASSLRSPER
jgi:hypothetical protein